MTENPFHSGPPASGERFPSEKSSMVSVAAILWHAIRLAFACTIFIVAPIFIAPVCCEIFEEFGIELPKISQLFLAWSDKLFKTMILSMPSIVAILLAIEIGLFHLPAENGKRLLSSLWWLLLVFALVFILVAILNPLLVVAASLRV